ncbi:MAG: BMP family protein [Alphaproteobacteria bacterium]
MNRIVPLALVAALAAPAAMAQDFAPAIVFDMGGKFDKSFNEAAYNGAERFRKETGIAYREFEVTSEAQRDQALRNLARRGATVIVAVGFAQAVPVEAAAKEFPGVKFNIVDEVVDLPNVQSFVFKEQEGSFLAGIMAAMASRSGRIGFVGGMDIPLIRAFGCGYAQGARHANPRVEIVQNMTGTTPAAWRDPTRGGELARAQFDRGVDVVYAAAGGTGLGVLQAAKDQGKLSIGVDSNQNHLHPGSVLTSMIKRVDVAVYEAFRAARENRWQAGLRNLGLKEEGVGVAIDEHNRRLVDAGMEAAVNRARDEIVAGRLSVVDYRQANSCPVQ